MTPQSEIPLDAPRSMQAGRIPLTFEIKARLGLARAEVAARGEPIPPAERRLGFDLSYWNQAVNHDTAILAGIQFGYFRATLGTTYRDSLYNHNRTNAGKRYPWGSYHAFSVNGAGGAQAANFCSTIGEGHGLLPPVIDVECNTTGTAVKSFCLELYSNFHTYGLIYTSAYMWARLPSHPDKTWVSNNCPLFVAHWSTLSPILPYGWNGYVVHQFSADGNGQGAKYGAPPNGDADMDLDFTRQAWLDSFSPPSTLEQRVATLEHDVARLNAAVFPSVE